MNKHLPMGLLMALMLIGAPAQGQFLKKLKKSVEQRVEQAAIEKIAAKTAGEADKLMDKAFDQLLEGGVGNSAGFPGGGEPVDASEIRETYEFEWLYELTVSTSQLEDPIPMTYLLKEGAPYWGMNIEQEGTAIMMIFDAEKMMTVMCMSGEDMKFMTASKLPETALEGEDFQDQEGYELKEIEGKEILGYDCKGFEMEDAQYKITVYTTFEAEVSLSDMYKKNEHFPDNFNMEWIREDDRSGMIMEMTIVNKSGSEADATMVCTRLEPVTQVISKADFQVMSGMMAPE